MAPSPVSRVDPTLGSFAGRVLIVLLLGALALAAWRLTDLLLLLFTAVLMAVGLRAAARSLTQATGIGNAAGLGVVVVLFVATLGLALWFFGSVVADQLDEVAQQVPAGLRMLLERLQAHPYGRYALEQARGISAAGATAWMASALAALGGALARGLGYAMLTFFMAIYLAAQPELYRRLCVRLTPPVYRPRTEQLFDDTADVLRRWLIGQLVVMLTIGILSGIGLWALGIEAAFALGVVGGLLTFIPYVGAVLAAVPATLVALTQGPVQALSVVLMYMGVHFIEGNFITPLVQAEATALPPVLALLSTVAFSVLFGPSAVLLAAPLTLFLMVAVEVLYVEQALGERASLPRLPQNAPQSSESTIMP
jgi:predicted PurR-regulated permease PerM